MFSKRVRNNTYGINSQNAPEAYKNSIPVPIATATEPVETEQLNKSLSSLSLKSELIANLTQNFERFESDVRVISKQSLDQNLKVIIIKYYKNFIIKQL
jgi:hypothetical protein